MSNPSFVSRALVIDTHIKGSKGDDLNALLKRYKNVYEGEGTKEYKINWMTHRVEEYPFPHAKIDITKFTKEERDTITEACRLLKCQLDETKKKVIEETYKS